MERLRLLQFSFEFREDVMQRLVWNEAISQSKYVSLQLDVLQRQVEFVDPVNYVI